jgi:AhpD family alkylhydroperoxidase
MQARMKSPVYVIPDAMKALHALKEATEQGGVPPATLALVELRASQINGCSFCVDMHARLMRKAGETEDRLVAVAAWRHAPYFTAPERAALALTEAATRLADREDPVPDAIWTEASRHYDEKGLAALILAIAAINVWNRLNVCVQTEAGHYVPGMFG